MTATTEEQISQDSFFVPSNLKQDRFTHYTINNLDFHEHTQDGTTLHATTHNIYQYMEEGEVAMQVGSIPLLKKRRASINDAQLFYTKQSNLTLKDRHQGRSLAEINILSSSSDDSGSPLDISNYLWQVVQMGPTDLLDDADFMSDFIPPTWSTFQDRLRQQ